MYTQSYGILAVAGIFLVLLWLICIALVVLNIIAMWKLFKKAGKPGWAAIIPFYNSYVLNEIAWGKGIYFLFLFIPLGNFVWLCATYIKLAKAFGKSTGFGVGMIFISAILIPVLAFGKSEYIGCDVSGKKGCIIATVVTGVVYLIIFIFVFIIAIVTAVTTTSATEDIYVNGSYNDLYDYDGGESSYEYDDYDDSSNVIAPEDATLNLSGYNDVSAVNLENDDVTIQMPIQDSDSTYSYGSMAFSSKDGVQVSLSINWYPLEDEMNDLAQEVTYQVEDDISYMEESEFYSNVEVEDMITGDGWVLQQYNYNYLLGDSAYPCFTIVKSENMEGYAVNISVEVDNSMANENTQDTLLQACELYGIDFDVD